MHSLRGIQADKRINFEDFRDVFASQSDHLAEIVDTAGRWAMFGGSGNDMLTDSSAGNDKLYGEAGNDVFSSGDGDDRLFGGEGNDTYVLWAGSGQDQISAYDSSVISIDTIQFEDVASTALRAMRRSGYDLVLEYGESDSITVRNFYIDYMYQVDRFVFSDIVTFTKLYNLFIPKISNITMLIKGGINNVAC